MNLTFTRHTDPTLGDTFALTGPEGAITFHPGTTNGIEVHSVMPLNGGVGGGSCDYTTTKTCYTDGSSLAGRGLRQRWDASGDDETVRVELAEWYRTHLGRAGR